MMKVTHIIQNLALTCFKQLQLKKKKKYCTVKPLNSEYLQVYPSQMCQFLRFFAFLVCSNALCNVGRRK